MNNKLLLRMFLYVFISTIITFVSLIDTINVHNFNEVSNLDWIKICLKSLLPGLVSLKAFFDTSLSDDEKALKIDLPLNK